MRCGVYTEHGICVRYHCGAEPPRDTARAARRRFRGVHCGRTAPSLPTETGITSGGGCLAGAVPSILERSRRCPRTPPRSHGSITNEESGANEEEDKQEITRRKPRT